MNLRKLRNRIAYRLGFVSIARLEDERSKHAVTRTLLEARITTLTGAVEALSEDKQALREKLVKARAEKFESAQSARLIRTLKRELRDANGRLRKAGGIVRVTNYSLRSDVRRLG